MTDQYLCRGKRLDNKRWIAGYLCKRVAVGIDGCLVVHDVIQRVNEGRAGMRSLIFKIDPTTVGRCTGLRDCEGRLIFEGDYLGDFAEDDDGDEIMGIMGVVTYWAHEGRWVLTDKGGYCNDWTLEDDALPENWKHLFTCGNVTDNPELLGGEQDG